MLTLTGCVIIVLAIVLSRLVANPLLVIFTFFIPFSATAIINIPSFTFSITPYHFFGGLLIATVGAAWLKQGINEAALDLACPFFWMTTFIVFLLGWLFAAAAVRGVTATVMLQTAILVMGLLVTWALAHSIETPTTARRLALAYLASGIFVASWGILQWICLNTGIHFPDDIFNNSISKGVNSDEILKNVGFTVYRMSSVTLEPSYFARFLCPALLFIIVLLGNGVGPKRLLKGCFVLFAAAVLLSTSTIGYLGLVLAGMAAVVLYARRLLPLMTIIGAGVAVVLLSFPRVLQAVLSVTVDKSESGSFDYRLWSMAQGYHAFTSAPFFGHGWGWYAGGAVATVHDFLFKMLSSVGVVGFAIFALYLLTGVARPLVALWSLSNHRRQHVLPPAAATDAAELQALTFGFLAAFALIFVLDAIATFSFFIGQQWFLFGAMVGMSRVVGSWLSRQAADARRGAAHAAADQPGDDPGGGPEGGRRRRRRRPLPGLVGIAGPAHAQPQRHPVEAKVVAQGIAEVAQVGFRNRFRAVGKQHEGRRTRIRLRHVAQAHRSSLRGGRRRPSHRRREPAVELRRRQPATPLPMQAHHRRQQRTYAVAGQSRQPEGLGSTQLRQRFLQPAGEQGRSGRAILDQVAFVDDDQRRAPLLDDQIGDRQILPFQPGGGVDDDQHNLRKADGTDGLGAGKLLKPVVDAGTAPQASGIEQPEPAGLAAPVDGDGVAGDPGFRTGDQAIASDQAVDQGRFADVRPADHGKLHRRRRSRRRRGRMFRRRGGRLVVSCRSIRTGRRRLSPARRVP